MNEETLLRYLHTNELVHWVYQATLLSYNDASSQREKIGFIIQNIY